MCHPLWHLRQAFNSTQTFSECEEAGAGSEAFGDISCVIFYPLTPFIAKPFVWPFLFTCPCSFDTTQERDHPSE